MFSSVDFLLFVMPTVVVHKFVLSRIRHAVLDLVLACSIAQQWEVTEKEIHTIERVINHWHSFLRLEIQERRLKPTIFVMNQHMLVHLGYMHCFGGWAARRRPSDKRTSNFEVASNDVAGLQFWSNPIRKTLAVIAIECDMNYHNLVRFLACLWDQDSAVMEHKTIEVVCTTKMWKDNVVLKISGIKILSTRLRAFSAVRELLIYLKLNTATLAKEKSIFPAVRFIFFFK
ncbi:hypothetical protein PHYBLDRAFT_171315 [Phycomyces blakesleeanus NRRL 1555(-)]|uniref:Uncharacterized protein n=1 Tax=Phycomyces blakesleeanus (strain ATCC 8743b / DSM 1359 / FGSC 10004 / NBRC 33097 / NRRL 1555) TaxID=763407 RepID=A0A163A2B0_PHYB8|nr:hypothetical protein PHYBLDRAFT_171315 [Phycomyces blakesleeanus NRRL 1555(-)]OAD70571.1 hypothetical protein PHYBLDRAFT_171315 [Phycomyces blakesleeanus NRRL 1555(-)]|eukprot:XP_018288611.1 hypothetical protein PHYBLDRAFT_171315 [Phycomyces blakesleeanus NRRL 1555(-)]